MKGVLKWKQVEEHYLCKIFTWLCNSDALTTVSRLLTSDSTALSIESTSTWVPLLFLTTQILKYSPDNGSDTFSFSLFHFQITKILFFDYKTYFTYSKLDGDELFGLACLIIIITDVIFERLNLYSFISISSLPLTPISYQLLYNTVS